MYSILLIILYTYTYLGSHEIKCLIFVGSSSLETLIKISYSWVLCNTDGNEDKHHVIL